MASSLGTNEIVLGELRARVEWESSFEGGTASVRAKRIQLVLVPTKTAMVGSTFTDDVVVVGTIEPPEEPTGDTTSA